MRNLTEADKISIVKKITGGWEQIFNDAIDVFDRANFVADEVTRSPLFTLVRTLSRRQCRLWARADKTNFTTEYNTVSSNICGQYLADIGENPAVGKIELPFLGGQCSDVNYSISYETRGIQAVNVFNCVLTFTNWQTYTSVQRQSDGAIVSVIPGPVSSVVREVTVFNTSSTNRRLRFVITANGVVYWLNILGVFNRDYFDGCTNNPAEFRNVVFTRSSGGPDICGNPTGLITPPNTPNLAPVGNTISITIPGYGPVTATVSIQPDETIEVCIVELAVCFTLDLGEKTSGDNSTPDPGDIGEPSEELSTGTDGETSGEAPEGTVLGGLKVTITSTPNEPSTFSGDVFRGVGYVYMGVPGNLALHFGAATMLSTQFFFPDKQNLTAWKVVANSGYNLSVIPYYLES